MTKKIVFVIPALSAGGAERVMSVLASRFATWGHDVTLLTYSDRGNRDFYDLGRNVRRVRLGEQQPARSLIQRVIANVKRLYAIRKSIGQMDPDTVISFMDGPNIITITSLLGMSVKVIVTERNDPSVWPPFRSWRLLRKILYRFADLTVVQTNSAREWFGRNCETKELVVIPNPVRDVSQQASERGKAVLAVGRLDPQKGFDILIKAFAQFSMEHPDWELQILGEGGGRTSLETLIERMGLQDKVTMPGAVKDVDGHYAKAGMFVLSSRFEGFPNVLIEAMRMGCAVVATDCPSGPSEIISHNWDGMLVDVDDVEELANVLTVLAQEKALREKLGSRAVERTESYNLNAIAEQWMLAINRIGWSKAIWPASLPF